MSDSNDAPTLAEVARRLVELTNEVRRLVEEVRKDYVPRELYNAQREADRDDHKALDTRVTKTEENRAADRRVILTALVMPLLVGLLLLYATVQFGGTA